MSAAPVVWTRYGMVRTDDVVMLGEAQLCQDCSAITAAPQGRCVRCGSWALLGLASVLNRKAEESEERNGQAS